MGRVPHGVCGYLIVEGINITSVVHTLVQILPDSERNLWLELGFLSLCTDCSDVAHNACCMVMRDDAIYETTNNAHSRQLPWYLPVV